MEPPASSGRFNVRDESTIHKHLIPYFGGNYIGAVKIKDLEDYKTFRAGRVKPRTVNRELDTLKSMFNRAVEWGWLKETPGKAVKRLKFQKQPPVYLDTTQLTRLLEECDTPHLRAFVVLGVYTGMRKSEILHLGWEDVDLKNRSITLRQTKNKEFRVVDMNELVWQTLRRHPRHISSPYLLARPDGRPFSDLRAPFEAALKRASLPRIRIHDLRHSFGSNLVAAGASLAVVKELLGHKDIQTTMIYAHLAPDMKRAAVELLVPNAGQDGQYMVTEQIAENKKGQAS